MSDVHSRCFFIIKPRSFKHSQDVALPWYGAQKQFLQVVKEALFNYVSVVIM